MPHLGYKTHFWRIVWIILRECQSRFEKATLWIIGWFLDDYRIKDNEWKM